MTAAHHQEYYNAVRDFNRKLWDVIHAKDALQAEWNGNNYSSTLSDGTQSNAGLTKADLGPFIFDTLDALTAEISGGHLGNIAKLL